MLPSDEKRETSRRNASVDGNHDDTCKDASASADDKCRKRSVALARGLSSAKTAK